MPQDQRPLAIALMGPTASGKTAYAIELAKKYNGEIISVDSALVYRGLDIGAAKPDKQLQTEIPHHLIDIRQPWQPYSAAEFADDAIIAINDIISRGKLPILAGGTGLYFRALTQGLSPLPKADLNIRAELIAQAQEHGWQTMHQRLNEIDPIAALRIKPSDTQRIQRALEVFQLTGKPISYWQKLPKTQRLPVRMNKLVLSPERRETLHARIEARFDRMLEQGFLQEVHQIQTHPAMQHVTDPTVLPAVRAVGYRQAWEYLQGNCSYTQFKEAAISATRQLAKRQFTWLKSELDARWFDPMQQQEKLNLAIISFLKPVKCLAN